MLAEIHRLTHQFATAEGYFRQILRLHETALAQGQIGLNPMQRGGVLNNLGITLSEQGQFAEAGTCFRQAMALAHAIGYVYGESVRSYNFGWFLYINKLDTLTEAKAHVEKALELARRIGNRAMENNATRMLTKIHHESADFAQAIESATSALQAARRLNDTDNWLANMYDLVILKAWDDDIPAALAYATEGLALAQAHQDSENEAIFYGLLGFLAWLADDLAGALTHFQTCMTRYQAVNINDPEGYAFVASAYSIYRLQQADAPSIEILLAAFEAPAVLALPEIKQLKGVFLQRRGEKEAAYALFHEAITLWERNFVYHPHVFAAYGLGLTYLLMGNIASAFGYYSKALDLAPDAGLVKYARLSAAALLPPETAREVVEWLGMQQKKVLARRRA